jgi:hypothetical protein
MDGGNVSVSRLGLNEMNVQHKMLWRVMVGFLCVWGLMTTDSFQTVKWQVLIFVLFITFRFILCCRQPIEYQAFRNSVICFYTCVMLMVLMLVMDCTDLDSYSLCCFLKSKFGYIPEFYTCWLRKWSWIIVCLLCHIRVANTTDSTLSKILHFITRP